MNNPAFIDLASHNDCEKILYGGDDSLNYFINDIQKSEWTTTYPYKLQQLSSLNFGQTCKFKIDRQGDMLFNIWIEVCIPKILSTKYPLRWQHNLLHNLVKHIYILSNQDEIVSLCSESLDAISAFTKDIKYFENIGNIPQLIDYSMSKDEHNLVCILPLFCEPKDSLRLATHPYSDVIIVFDINSWTNLIIVNSPDGERLATTNDVELIPILSKFNVYVEHVIVPGDLRLRMVHGLPFIQVIDNYQIYKKSCNYIFKKYKKYFVKDIFHIICSYLYDNNTINTYDISKTISGSIKTLYFMILDTSKCDLSNYEVLTNNISFGYGECERMNMSPLYYSIIQPQKQPNLKIPNNNGYYMYSYSLDTFSTNPSGSTNFSKLQDGLQDVWINLDTNFCEIIVVAVEHKIISYYRGILRSLNFK
jgi:hypothetical protein